MLLLRTCGADSCSHVSVNSQSQEDFQKKLRGTAEMCWVTQELTTNVKVQMVVLFAGTVSGWRSWSSSAVSSSSVMRTSGGEHVLTLSCFNRKEALLDQSWETVCNSELCHLSLLSLLLSGPWSSAVKASMSQASPLPADQREAWPKQRWGVEQQVAEVSLLYAACYLWDQGARDTDVADSPSVWQLEQHSL